VNILPDRKSHDPDFFMSDNAIIYCMLGAAMINGCTNGISWASANHYIAESSTE
jgi:hypothetical protein